MALAPRPTAPEETSITYIPFCLKKAICLTIERILSLSIPLWDERRLVPTFITIRLIFSKFLILDPYDGILCH